MELGRSYASFKKGIGLLLAIVMLIGLLPGAAMAVENAAMVVPSGTRTVSVTNWEDLRDAITSTHTNQSVHVVIANNITSTGNSIRIQGNRRVYLSSAGTGVFSIFQHAGAGDAIDRRHFFVEFGTLSLGNVHLTRNLPETDMRETGGVTLGNTARLYMFDGSVIGNNRGVAGVSVNSPSATLTMVGNSRVRNNVNGGGGGGGVVVSSGTFNMSGNAQIYGNSAFHGGGGVILTNATAGPAATFNMSGNAVIRDNVARTSGGGVTMGGTFSHVMHMSDNARIENNRSEGTGSSGGGGVNVGNGTLYMHGGVIRGNISAGRGGGVQVSADSNFIATAGSITGNQAATDGGGIFSNPAVNSHVLSANAYANLSIGPAVLFGGNSAGNGSTAPPINWDITDIRGSGTSPSILAHRGHQLNNYDINFRRPSSSVAIVVGEDDRVAVDVRPGSNYSVNQSRGDIIVTLPDISADTDIDVSLPGGWSWVRGIDGSGNVIATFTPPIGYEVIGTHPDLILRSTQLSFTVTFNAHGGTGNMVDITGLEQGDTVTVPASGLTRAGHIQLGWFLDCPENGAFVPLGSTFIIQNNATLYPRWIIG